MWSRIQQMSDGQAVLTDPVQIWSHGPEMTNGVLGNEQQVAFGWLQGKQGVSKCLGQGGERKKDQCWPVLPLGPSHTPAHSWIAQE